MRFSFDDLFGYDDGSSGSYVGTQVIGKLDDLVIDAAAHATVNTNSEQRCNTR
jgi:hypothetical protein